MRLAVEAELRPKVVEADLVLVPVAMLVAEPDAVIAEPMAVVAGILVEPAEPTRAVLEIFAGVVEPMVVDAESAFVMAVPMGAVAAAALVGLEVDPKLVAFAADLAAHESESKVAEIVHALEADSRMVGLEESRHL